MALTLKPHYVIDEERKTKAVILTIEEWRRVVEELEELDDTRAYDAAKTGPKDAISFERAIGEIEEGRIG